MQRLFDGATAYSWEGDLTEFTEVSVTQPGRDPQVVPFHRVVTMTNGAILDVLAGEGLSLVESAPGGADE